LIVSKISTGQSGLKTLPNSNGLINWLRQPGQLLNQPQKSMREKYNPLIKFCCTLTVPAAETQSIGLSADAQLSWFLQSHLDSFTVTRDSQPSTGIRPSRQLCLDTETFSHLLGLYMDQKACARLPGLCKNSCQRVQRSATH
jgi:hypothetical protein